MQIGDISAQLVGKACDGVEPALKMLASLGMLEEADTTCFYVAAQVRSGLYILIACAVLLNVATQFITRAADSAMEDREHRIKYGNDDEKHLYRAILFREAVTGLLSVCCALEVTAAGGDDEGGAKSNEEWQTTMAPFTGCEMYFHHRTGTMTSARPPDLDTLPKLAEADVGTPPSSRNGAIGAHHMSLA